MRPLLIDLETRSAADLKEVGGHVYACDPSTRLLTAAWCVDDQYHVWLPGATEVPHEEPGVTYHYGPVCPLAQYTDRVWCAHNAWGFDQLVWEALGLPRPKRWVDSMCLALAAGLPGQIDQIGIRLWGEGKHKEGGAALKKHTRAVDLRDADPRNVPPGITGLIASYNVQDVKLLVALWDEIAESLVLTNQELTVSRVHQEINNRGVRVDLNLIRALADLSERSVEIAVAEIRELTNGELGTADILRKRNSVLAWLEKQGLVLYSGKKKTLRREVVESFLQQFEEEEQGEQEEETQEEYSLDPKKMALCAKVLKLRNAVLRITGKKLQTALARQKDGILHGLFAYYAAHTGRFGGRGVQVQNLPRPSPAVDVWPSLTKVRHWWRKGGDPRKILGTEVPLDDYAASLLRGCFIPHRGDTCLLAGDFSGIESRVLAWLAGEEKLLSTFREFGCPYSLVAAQLYGRPVQGKKDPIRQVGKVIVLGCGYQLGPKTFAAYGAANGIDFDAAGVSPAQCVETFRSSFPAIAGTVMGEFEGRPWRRGGFWGDLNLVALATVDGRGPLTLGKLQFEHRRGHLYLTLPSGRSLCYRNARIVKVQRFGKEIDAVQYQSPRFRDTVLYGGKIAENVVQAVSRDFLTDALVRMRHMRIVLHVHDEIVVSGHREQFEEFMHLLTTNDSWGAGLPLDAEGGILPRYGKSPPKHWPKEQLWRNGSLVREA